MFGPPDRGQFTSAVPFAKGMRNMLCIARDEEQKFSLFGQEIGAYMYAAASACPRMCVCARGRPVAVTATCRVPRAMVTSRRGWLAGG